MSCVLVNGEGTYCAHSSVRMHQNYKWILVKQPENLRTRLPIQKGRVSVVQLFTQQFALCGISDVQYESDWLNVAL